MNGCIEGVRGNLPLPHCATAAGSAGDRQGAGVAVINNPFRLGWNWYLSIFWYSTFSGAGRFDLGFFFRWHTQFHLKFFQRHTFFDISSFDGTPSANSHGIAIGECLPSNMAAAIREGSRFELDFFFRWHTPATVMGLLKLESVYTQIWL